MSFWSGLRDLGERCFLDGDSWLGRGVGRQGLQQGARVLEEFRLRHEVWMSMWCHESEHVTLTFTFSSLVAVQCVRKHFRRILGPLHMIILRSIAELLLIDVTEYASSPYAFL